MLVLRIFVLLHMCCMAKAQTSQSFCDSCICTGAFVICDSYLPDNYIIENAIRVGDLTLIIKSDFNKYYGYKSIIDNLFTKVIVQKPADQQENNSIKK